MIESLVVHEAEVQHPDGTCFRMQIRPYRTVEQKIAGAVISFVDVTELRRSVEAAQLARDYAAAIVQTVPTPLVVVDGALRVHSANRAFLAAFDGIGEPRGRELLALGAWSGELRGRLADVVATGVSLEGVEVEHVVPGAEVRVLAIAATPIAGGDGPGLVLVGIADVTDRRRLERTRLVAERERDGFLAAVSHELRTPLSAILLWAEVLRGLDPSDPRWQTALDTIVHSAAAEAHLVDDLLDLARSRVGELGVAQERVEPAAVIRAAVDAMRARANAKQVAIELELTPGATISADPRRLEHIAAKLLSNAVKFTPAGGTIRVALARADHTVELSVGDNGPGIAADFLPYLFEPFAQEDRSSTRAHAGLGIGLALVRHLVERQGGTIRVASTEGAGTTFTVRFPSS